MSQRDKLTETLSLKRRNIAPDVSEAVSRIVLEYLASKDAEILRLRGQVEEHSNQIGRLKEACTAAREEGVEQAFREGFNVGWDVGYEVATSESQGYRAHDVPKENEAWEQSEAAAAIRPGHEAQDDNTKSAHGKDVARYD